MEVKEDIPVDDWKAGQCVPCLQSSGVGPKYGKNIRKYQGRGMNEPLDMCEQHRLDHYLPSGGRIADVL